MVNFVAMVRVSKLLVSNINPHPQTRHNLVGEIRIFSVKICINPYPSFLCINVSRKRSYRDAVWRHFVI